MQEKIEKVSNIDIKGRRKEKTIVKGTRAMNLVDLKEEKGRISIFFLVSVHYIFFFSLILYELFESEHFSLFSRSLALFSKTFKFYRLSFLTN